MNHSTPGLPVHHQLPESTQTHVLWVSYAIQPSHLLLSHSPPALNLSQHQGLFIRDSPSHQVAKVLEFQLQHQSFQWIFRITGEDNPQFIRRDGYQHLSRRKKWSSWWTWGIQNDQQIVTRELGCQFVVTVRTERDSHSLIASECMVPSLCCEGDEVICALWILRIKESRIHSRGKKMPHWRKVLGTEPSLRRTIRERKKWGLDKTE